MNKGTFVTPLSIEHLYVIESELKVGDAPTGQMDAELGINLNDEETPYYDEELRRYSLSKTLEVSSRLVDAKDPEAVSLFVSVTVLIEAVLPVEGESEQAAAFMRESCVSIAYSHARSCIMNMVSMSPARELIIPTIFPQALAEMAADSDEGEE